MKKKAQKIISLTLVFVLLMSSFSLYANASRDPITDFYEPAYWKFKDVPPNRWSFSYIKLLKDSRVIDGVTKTSFEPTSFVTRAQFVKMLGMIAGIKTYAYKGTAFQDVKEDQWYAPYVKWASKTGITKGTEPNKFEPNAHILRQDIAVMIYRYVTVVGIELPTDGQVRSFVDKDSISSYAKKAVKAMQKADIISGNKNSDKTYSFNPKEKATREETAKMLCVLNEYQLLKIKEKGKKSYACEIMKNWILSNDNIPYSFGRYAYAETLVYEKNNIQNFVAVYDEADKRLIFYLDCQIQGKTYSYSVNILMKEKSKSFSVGHYCEARTYYEFVCNHTFTKDDGCWGDLNLTLDYFNNYKVNDINDEDIKRSYYAGGEILITLIEYLFKYQICRTDLSTEDFNLIDVGQFDI